jgi:ribokinase
VGSGSYYELAQSYVSPLLLQHGKPVVMPRILVVGSINLDLAARVSRLPKPGETVPGDTLIQTPGGKGANQAVAAARLGASTTMLGRVGDDAFGQVLLAALVASGVNTEHVHVIPQCSSGVALIGVETSGQNAITVIRGANAHLLPDDVIREEELFANADAVLVQLEVPFATVAAACRLARKHGTLVVLDPAPAPRVALPPELWAADLICPNQGEAESLTGIVAADAADAARAAKVLQGRGARQVVIKLAERGALTCDQDGTSAQVPAPLVKVVDTVAAGDAFQAALAVALIEGWSLVEATRFACAAGALATTKVGAQDAMPRREDVERLLSSS